MCGESSALMRSVEGKVGEPRAKYVHATDRGLFDSPTVLNNVETWVNVPRIIEQGADWFLSLGTAKSKGTKAFALTGKVMNTGLVEVEMGTSLRDIIWGAGGGAPRWATTLEEWLLANRPSTESESLHSERPRSSRNPEGER